MDGGAWWATVHGFANSQTRLRDLNFTLMLKLNLQYFGHLMGRADSLEKMLVLDKIKGRALESRFKPLLSKSQLHFEPVSLSIIQ